MPTASPAVDSKELAAKFLLPWVIVSFIPVLFLARMRDSWAELDRIAFLAVIASGVLSCVLSSRAAYSCHWSWHMWAIVALGYAITILNPTVAESRKLILSMVAAGILCSLYGLGIYFGFDPLHPLFPFAPGQQESRNYIHSFLGNPEYFGGYMAPVAALSFCQVLRSRSRAVTRMAWLGVCLLFLFSLALSGARGALIGFAVAASICLFSQLRYLAPDFRRWITRLIWGVGLSLVALVAVFSFPNPLNYRGSHLAHRFVDLFDITSASVRERIFFFAISGRIIAAHPLVGDGPGTYRLNFYPYVEELETHDPRAGVLMMASYLHNRIAEHAHCDYLEIWCETGIVGVAAYLLVIAVAVQRFRRSRERMSEAAGSSDASFREQADDIFLVRTSFFAATACVFINAAFSFPLHMPVRASLAWVCLGGFFGACRRLEHLRP